MTKVNDFFDKLEGVWRNKLDGKWQDSFGWNFISQPKLGEPGSSDFNMRFDQMRETITLKKLGGPPARNVGISGDAGFWQGIKYELAIETPANQGLIHHEMGYFLLSVGENGETSSSDFGQVIRQATIPRANAMMTTGRLFPDSVSNAVDIYDARPTTSDPDLQAKIDEMLRQKQSEIEASGGPPLRSPLRWLAERPVGNVSGIDWVFSFRDDKNPSQMASGQRVVKPVGIGNLISDFWIGDREIGDKNIEILQYTQKVDLKFHGVDWPHLAINTLVKQ